ncbi:MAG: acylneuraminate cytidylyltransferase family protein [Clostridia bacterium]|nr:acylneuraminate cytidylyltransferase family protein [Clostridia bacterium]
MYTDKAEKRCERMNCLKDKKILCIIPARAGSKRVLGKNTRNLCGKPLIGWTIEAARNASYVDRTVVSTEDDHIAGISKSFGAEVVIRPPELAQDTSKSTDALIHAIGELKKENYNPDYILLLQCTSPLRTSLHIDEALKMFIEKENIADSMMSLSKTAHPPYFLRKLDEDDVMHDFLEYDREKYTRSQDFGDFYEVNGALYLVRTDILLEKQILQTEKTLGFVMDRYSSVDIDTEFDFMFAEYLMDLKVNKGMDVSKL